MKQRFFVMALALTMVMGLSGCGRNADATSPSDAETPSAASTPSAATNEPNAPVTTAEPSAASSGLSGLSDEEKDAMFQEALQDAVDSVIHGEIDEDDLEELRRLTGETAEDDSLSSNGPATPATVEPQGLIVMTVEHADQVKISVANFNAQTGDLQTVASWSNPDLLDLRRNKAVVYSLPNNTQFNSEREWFSAEYDRLAVTMIRRSDNETHAGWLETDGTFFDVTEALGQQSSDFGDAVKYAARGFTADGLFVFSDGRQNYYVPLDNLTAAAVQTGNGFALGHPTDQTGYRPTNHNEYYVTDWLDGNTCLATRWSSGQPTTNAVITDASKPEEILTSSSRYNWNMYLSPDGSQVAFMSMPSSGTESPDAFIMAYPDGEPTRVAAHKFAFTLGIDFYGSRNWDCFLIDWR